MLLQAHFYLSFTIIIFSKRFLTGTFGKILCKPLGSEKLVEINALIAKSLPYNMSNKAENIETIVVTKASILNATLCRFANNNIVEISFYGINLELSGSGTLESWMLQGSHKYQASGKLKNLTLVLQADVRDDGQVQFGSNAIKHWPNSAEDIQNFELKAKCKVFKALLLMSDWKPHILSQARDRFQELLQIRGNNLFRVIVAVATKSSSAVCIMCATQNMRTCNKTDLQQEIGEVGGVIMRKELSDYFSDCFSQDIFLLAYKEMQLDNSLIYFNVTGIHGLPRQAFNGIPEENSFFCQHGTELFPVWHRPYIFLYESILRNKAKKIASKFQPHLRPCYENAAKRLRIPYWDWAASPAIPDCFLETTVKVPNFEDGRLETVDNPLFSYKFQKTVETNENDRHLLYGLPKISKNSNTLRHPTPDGLSSNITKFQMTLQDQFESIRKIWCIAMESPSYDLLYFDSPPPFSWANIDTNFQSTVNRYIDRAWIRHKDASLFSLEAVHGWMHDIIGGYNGHMSYVPVSAFDPIFILHHVNIDRLFAIWQLLHPDRWPRKKSFANSRLLPFKDELLGTVVKAMETSDIRRWNSIYPEHKLVQQSDYDYEPENLRSALLRKLRNNYQCDSQERYMFYARIVVNRNLYGSVKFELTLREQGNLKNRRVVFPSWIFSNALQQLNNSGYIIAINITAAVAEVGIDVDDFRELSFVRKAQGNAKFEVELSAQLMNCMKISAREAGVKLVQIVRAPRGIFQPQHFEILSNLNPRDCRHHYDCAADEWCEENKCAGLDIDRSTGRCGKTCRSSADCSIRNSGRCHYCQTEVDEHGHKQRKCGEQRGEGEPRLTCG